MAGVYLRSSIAVALAAVLCIFSGCGKAKEKMKMPDIKMVTGEDVIAAAAPDDDNVWVIGDYGVVFHSGDGGTTWTAQTSGVETTLCDVAFVDKSTGWIGGTQGVLLSTQDGGTTWVRQDSGTKRHLLSLSFVDKEYGWAVGEFSTILHTTDGGKTWLRQKEESDRIYNRVCFVDRNNGWIVGEAGIILHTADGGTTWEQQLPESFKRENLEDEYDRPRPTLFGLCFRDKLSGWICGMDSTIMHTADGGTSWEVLKTNKGEPVYNISVKANRGWVVGNKGTYLLSRDGGMTWERQEENIKSKLLFADAVFSSQDAGWVVGASGTILRTTDGGETWKFCSGLSYVFEGFKMPEGLEKRVIE
ncbi:MAG: YCF48-related protein [Pseudomonadota bacterium]